MIIFHEDNHDKMSMSTTTMRETIEQRCDVRLFLDSHWIHLSCTSVPAVMRRITCHIHVNGEIDWYSITASNYRLVPPYWWTKTTMPVGCVGLNINCIKSVLQSLHYCVTCKLNYSSSSDKTDLSPNCTISVYIRQTIMHVMSL